eukprot:14979932-Heterocapsa_arctica.AAC.1
MISEDVSDFFPALKVVISRAEAELQEDEDVEEAVESKPDEAKPETSPDLALSEDPEDYYLDFDLIISVAELPTLVVMAAALHNEWAGTWSSMW